MTLPRRVEPEWLDELPKDNPRAVRSRRDLKRINALMFQSQIMARLLLKCYGDTSPRMLIELGGGDGTFIAGLAGKLARRWPRVTIISVDRQDLVGEETRSRINDLNWRIETVTADVFDFLGHANSKASGIFVANLFLHHFPEEALSRLLGSVASSTWAFAACEPWRAGFVLAASRMLFALGCNDVTRHDSVTSVRAGFRGRELSHSWPSPERWHLYEHAVPPFTHCFAARRAA